MTKHEIRVEIKRTEEIKNLIQLAYFEEGFGGKLIGKKYFLTIPQDDEINWTIFSDLHNSTVKVVNEEIIDGTMRFVIDKSEGEVRLYPISIHCIQEEDKYIFY